MRVPLAEDIIWPAVHRMAMIVGARIDGQLIKQLRIKVSLMEQRRLGRSEDGHRFLDKVVIPAPCRSRAADKQRYRPEPLVIIGFALRTGFQNRDRPVADEIVEKIDRAFDNAWRFGPGAALQQNGL